MNIEPMDPHLGRSALKGTRFALFIKKLTLNLALRGSPNTGVTNVEVRPVPEFRWN